MINGSNILTYIKFLYQKKYEKVAPAQLLSQWRSVPEHQIQSELQKLYAHWQWSVQQGRKEEEAFIQLSNLLATQETKKTVVTPQPTIQEKPKRKTNWWAWLTPLLVVAIAYGIYTNYESNKVVEAPQENTEGTLLQEPEQELPVVPDTTIATEELAEPAEEEEPMEDKINKVNIRNYIMSEDERDLESIFGLLSPNIYKYYDLDYPTQNQLRNRYEHIWGITKDNTNYISRIEKVGARTYEVFGTYEYVGLKTGEEKTLLFTLRYEFDEDNRIISIDATK